MIDMGYRCRDCGVSSMQASECPACHGRNVGIWSGELGRYLLESEAAQIQEIQKKDAAALRAGVPIYRVEKPSPGHLQRVWDCVEARMDAGFRILELLWVRPRKVDVPEPPVLRNPFNYRALYCALFGFPFLALGCLAIYLDIQSSETHGVGVIHGSPWIMAITMMMVVASICLIPAAGIFFYQGRRLDRALASYQAGDILVKWRLPAAEWEKWVKQRMAPRYTAANALFLVLTAGGLIYGGYEYSDAWGPRATHDLIFFSGLGFGLALPSALAIRIWTRRCTYRMLQTGGSIFLSNTSVYCGGESLYWNSLCYTLRGSYIAYSDLPNLAITVDFSIGAAAGLLQVAAASVGRFYSPGSGRTVMRLPFLKEQIQQILDAAGKLNNQVSN
jgi:hypothetical protein